jgi:ABC-type transport system involved in cytochrome bd biosynthesis fused ATPase/permease subunit
MIADAMAGVARLVLLDEPTFLDAEAAVALEKRLAAWGQDRRLILVTHHLAAARNADAILGSTSSSAITLDRSGC